MDPYAERLKQHRRLTPPPGAVEQVEQRVMAQLDGPPPSRLRPFHYAAAAALGGVILVLLILTAPPRSPRPVPPDFVASVVLLDDHTCIWLERVETPPLERRAHE